MEPRDLPRLDQRRSGILLHLTSLPGPYGCGGLGKEARAFADCLAEAGQSWWQMLPVGPPGYGHCPYMASSAFALSTRLISLEDLAADGQLSSDDLLCEFTPPAGRAAFEAGDAFLAPRLLRAWGNFERRARGREREAFASFCAREAGWLDDYALFCALKETSGGAAWTDWDEALRRRKPAALAEARETLAQPIALHSFLQFALSRQWQDLRSHCRLRSVGLIGDLPIFVAHESADVWAHPEIFHLDEDGCPTVVAGVPPDYFSPTGQRWGHPLYRWPVLREQGYGWWIRRFQRLLQMFDAVRIDHFIGFHRYWEIPAACPTAVEGRWVAGPGEDFFDVLIDRLGPVPVIAEDLGLVTPEVLALRDRYGFPGMRILQFAFGGDAVTNPHLPHLYENPTVAYTGTHDNDTAVSWQADLVARARSGEEAARRELAYLEGYLGSRGEEIHWELIRLALASIARLAVLPLQDLLGIGPEGRMNRPSEAGGNWEWRLERGALSPETLLRLRRLTETFGRAAQP